MIFFNLKVKIGIVMHLAIIKIFKIIHICYAYLKKFTLSLTLHKKQKSLILVSPT